jgi:hypothetical protein
MINLLIKLTDMKIRKINILLAVSLGAMVAFSGCSKDDGAIPERVSIAAVPTITTNIDATGSQSIDLTNPTSFAGKFKVDLYFPGTTPPSKVDIVVRKWNGASANNNNVKVYKAGVTTFPTTLTVTAAEIATLFGTPIVLGDTYDFAPDIYVGDRKFEAFPVVGNGTGAGLNGQPFFSEFARFVAICAYDPNIYQGNFVITKDLWGDTFIGQVVLFTKIDNTHFSFVYNPYPQLATGTLLNATPIIVTVNPASNTPSVALQTVGTGWTYDGSKPVQVQTTASTNNNLAPCAKTISLNLNWTQGNGSYTGAVFQLVKQ